MNSPLSSTSTVSGFTRYLSDIGPEARAISRCREAVLETVADRIYESYDELENFDSKLRIISKHLQDTPEAQLGRFRVVISELRCCLSDHQILEPCPLPILLRPLIHKFLERHAGWAFPDYGRPTFQKKERHACSIAIERTDHDEFPSTWEVASGPVFEDRFFQLSSLIDVQDVWMAYKRWRWSDIEPRFLGECVVCSSS